MAENGDEGAVGFSIEDWAKKYKINRKTVAALRSEEAVDETTLKDVTARDLNKMDLTIGQASALRQGLAALGNHIKEAEVEENAQEEEVDADINRDTLEEAGNILDDILQDQKKEKKDTTVRKKHSGGYDPRMILTIKATTRKALQIVDFLPEHVKTRVNKKKKENFTLTEGENGGLTLKTEETAFYVSIDEWGAANQRILAHMIQEGLLDRREIEYYLSYTVMVFEFVPRYEWASILTFDKRYREMQAQHEFEWGSFAAQLEMQLLTPRRPMHPKTQAKKDAPLCKLFATRGTCTFGESCRFRHERQPDKPVGKNDQKNSQ